MARPGDAGRESTIRSETKASVLRGRIEALRRTSKLEQITEALDPPTRALVLAPPLGGTWIDTRVLFEIDAVVFDLLGAAATKRYGAEAVRTSVVGVMKFAVESTLRLFGVSPANLLAHMGRLSASAIRGTEYTYTALGPKHGVLEQRYLVGAGCPFGAWLTSTGGLLAVFDATSTTGIVSDPEVVQNGQSNTARYRLSW